MLIDYVARGIGHTVEAFPVNRTIDGPWPGAGPRRNARMLREGRPDRGLAFGALWRPSTMGERQRGGRWRKTGTGGMVALMLAAGLPVRWIAAPGATAVDLVKMPEPGEEAR